MVRWRWCLLMATLLLVRADNTNDDDDEQDDSEENGDKNDDEEYEDEPPERASIVGSIGGVGRRAPPPAMDVQSSLPPRIIHPATLRPTRKRPLECYVCSFKAETQLRACLDPTKYRVHSAMCSGPDEKCFTMVMLRSGYYEAVVRGCRTSCVGNTDTNCCDTNLCNNQAYSVPTGPPHALKASLDEGHSGSKSTKPQTVFFFITVLLVLQTVVKVAIV